MNLHDIAVCSNVFLEAVHKSGTPTATQMKLMVGLLVSSKTLAGNTNRWTDRYPPVRQIEELTSIGGEHLLHTIHYNTDDQATIDEQIDEVMKLSKGIDAIQLNIKWVSPVKLQRIRRRYPDLRIILQIGAGALAEVDEPDDIHLGDALNSYGTSIDDFLVDPSAGEGKPLDIWRAFACIADHEIPVHIQPGVAGGRYSGNLHELRGLMRRLKRPVNVDAERLLRTSTEGGGHLIIDEAVSFTRNGVALISSF